MKCSPARAQVEWSLNIKGVGSCYFIEKKKTQMPEQKAQKHVLVASYKCLSIQGVANKSTE